MAADDRPPGVPRKMPLVSQSGYGNNVLGIQKYRQESYTMTDKLKSPYPYPGGKSDAAPAIWARLGDTPNYCEPFAGSAAALLARPHDLDGKTETVNDIDGLLINALRSITFAPEETAAWCDWPVSEADLTSRHLHLKAARAELTARLFGDPLYCDPLLGAWWLWGIASWIGDGWCVADGPWINVDGRLVDRRTLPEDERAEGVWRTLPEVGYKPGNWHGKGIQRYRAQGVPRKMPEVGAGGADGGMKRGRGVQAVRYQGVPKQMPVVGSPGEGGARLQGITRYEPSALLAYFTRLADRLRRVRFLCGDWKRALKDSVTVNHGTTGIFLDPPYPAAEHDMGYHSEEAGDVWHQAADWAVAHGDDPRLRICIAGYWSEDVDRRFHQGWERLRWEARGGYANQKADGRGRSNAKRECLWFSPHCIDAKTDYGPLFAGLESEE